MNDPAAESPPVRTTTAPVGARWALGFGFALLAAFALLTVARLVQRPSAVVEEIVQTPVPATVPTPTPAVLAPDPGDNP